MTTRPRRTIRFLSASSPSALVDSSMNEETSSMYIEKYRIENLEIRVVNLRLQSRLSRQFELSSSSASYPTQITKCKDNFFAESHVVSSINEIIDPLDDPAAFCSQKVAEQFKHVLSNLRLTEVEAVALEVRKSLGDIAENEVIGCTIQQPPFNGYYNLVYPLQFSDGIKWGIKFPRRGHIAEWSPIAAEAMLTEASIMNLLKRETTIPTAAAYAVDATVDNRLGCPWMLMEWIEGTSLSKFWDINVPKRNQLALEQKVHILQDVASAVIQLGKFRTSKCGMPVFDETGRVTGAGPAIFRDCMDDTADALASLHVAGPFSAGDSFVNWRLDLFRAKYNQFDEDDVLFHLISSWYEEADPQPGVFTLSHRDLGPQNILIDENFRLTGIIDWDMACMLPTFLSNGINGSYPHWLARDLDLWHGGPSHSSGSSNEEATTTIPQHMANSMLPQPETEQPPNRAREFALTHKINEEEQDFYRTIWRTCLENATTSTTTTSSSLNPLTPSQIIARTPRTHAKCFTHSGSLDARLLVRAAENPTARLHSMMDSFRYQLSRVGTGQFTGLESRVDFMGIISAPEIEDALDLLGLTGKERAEKRKEFRGLKERFFYLYSKGGYSEEDGEYTKNG